MNTVRPKNIVIKEFNKRLFELIKLFENTAETDIEGANVSRLKKRILLLKSTLGDNHIIQLTSPAFISLSQEIMSRDEDFFMNVDVRKKYIDSYKEISREDEFMFSLIDMAKNRYKKSDKAEKDYLYGSIRILYKDSLEYNLSV